MTIGKKILRITAKSFSWLIGIFIILFVLVWVVLKVPTVQNYLVSKATSYVHKKTQTRVEIDYIDIGFPKSILLQGVFLEDKKKDTLLYIKELEVNLNMLSLLNHTVSVQRLTLDQSYLHLVRNEQDSTFNFQFLVDAFIKVDNKKEVITPTTSSKPWNIRANNISLKNFRFDMKDNLTGVEVVADAGYIKAELNKLDLQKSSVDVGKIKLEEVHAAIELTKASSTDTISTSSSGWNEIKVSEISMEQSSFSFKDALHHTNIISNVGEFKLAPTHLNLSTQTIKSDGLLINRSIALLELWKNNASSPKTNPDTSSSQKGWTLELAFLEMEKNNFLMDFTNTKKMKAGIDWNHLHLSDLTTSIEEIQYNKDFVSATVQSLSTQEKSGFGIKSLKAIARIDNKQAELSNLSLSTNHSIIGQNLKIEYSSLEKISSPISLDISMHNNQFAVQELLFLLPELDTIEIIHKNRNRIVAFDLTAKGNLNYLFIHHLSLKTASTNIVAKGKLKNITDPNKLYMDLSLDRMLSGALDLSSFLPDSTIPSSIHLPDSIFIKGNYQGTLCDFKMGADLISSTGNVSAKADIHNFRKESPDYSILLNSNHFDLGKFLNQTTLGKLNGKVEVNGKGFQKETASAKIDAEINSFGIYSYNYQNISLKGKIDHGLVKAVGKVADTNLVLSFDTHINLDSTKEEYDLKLVLSGSDLFALGLSKDHISMTANTDIKLLGDPTNYLNGHIAMRNILILKNGRKYKTDSLVLVSVNEPGKARMKLNSSMIGASFGGNIDILSVGPAITNHLNRYFQFSETASKPTKSQNFNFEIQLNDSPLLREVIFSSLKEYSPLYIKGSFNSDEAKLAINAEIPFIKYSDLSINGLSLTIDSDPDKLKYSTHWNYFKTSAITLQQTILNGKVSRDTATINLQIKTKEKEEDKLLLQSFVTKASKGHYRFSIFPNGLELEGKRWEASEKNFIEFAKNYVYADQFKLTKGEQSISLQSSGSGNDMTLRFSSFNLHSLSQIVEEDKPMVQGSMDGAIQLKDFLHNPAFTSELKIRNLIFKESRIGNLEITGDNLTAQRYTAKIILTDSTNRATVSGYYLTNQEKNALNFNAAIESIELASLEGFSKGQLSNSSGIVKGNISISGAVKDPKFNGDLRFINVSTKVSYINQKLFVRKEKISFTEDKISFKSFTVNDSLNNEAIINGYVGIKSLDDINFNLGIVTKKFMVLNTTAVNNKLYYGRMILDSKISIKGTPELPIINANIDIVGGSHFTFAIPDSKISVDRGNGIVVFTTDSSTLDPIMLRQQEELAGEKITGLDITANISIDKNSTLKILVDPISGDSLSVKGDADLNFRMDASGETSLNGRYIVSEGSYKASLENLLVRRFKIAKGSTILWTGDPLEALIDISATYSTKTAPEGLLSNSVILDSSALRKPLPFTVVMMMRGELLKPIISFKLDMPDNSKGALGGEVYSKITEINANESEVNKQVFALLVLNRFIAPDNGGSDGTASAFARRSVSRMMSNELNKLSSKYVNGLQIDVDIQSYNDINNGQQQGNTQVELGITKSLLDERLSVQVGTNVAIEGQNANANSNAKNFTGDVIVEYKLTKNGRYKVKAFRTNQYDGIANGTIVQTGVGLGYTRNFNHVKELFISKRKRKKK